MTNTSTNIVNTGAMPVQQISPMPAGATSPMSAGILKQQSQIDQQMALIGKTGGSKIKQKKQRHLIGGAVVQVPPLQSGSENPQATLANFMGLTKLSQGIQTQSTFDGAQNAGDTATIASKQQALYKTGVSKRGGSWPVWGCSSGGKQKRKTRKTRGMSSGELNTIRCYGIKSWRKKNKGKITRRKNRKS